MERIISTLTLNPSLDKTMYFDAPFKVGTLNRACASVPPIIGSKGINVSRMLAVCGVESTAWGFAGGDNGRLARSQLDAEGISHRFIETRAETRLNVKLIDSNGHCTEANERGGPVTADELESLFEQLERFSKPGQIFTIGGSVPQGVEKSVYKSLITMLKTRGIYCVLDCDGEPLSFGMEAGPSLIKPNLYELSLLLGREISPDQAENECARLYKETGAEVLCTLGGDGSVFAGKEGLFRVKCPKVEVKGFTGAGDTVLAVFLYRRVWKNDGADQALERANSAAVIKVQLPSTQMPSREALHNII